MTNLTFDESEAAMTAVKDKGDQVCFLVHDRKDGVGVAVVDIQKGETVNGISLDRQTQIEIVARMDIPLGHKVALKDFAPQDVVIKYGEPIGVVVAQIRKGDHIHVHNLKTARW